MSVAGLSTEFCISEREEGSWAAACAAKARVGAYTSFDCPACEVAKDA